MASQQNFNYVICGHIHKAQLRTVKVGNNEIIYMNSGDWVESLTSLEFIHDKWSIYEYSEIDYLNKAND
jgi:UDP-2,3-diacylglucosamine pyrophosphatase LpxH